MLALLYYTKIEKEMKSCTSHLLFVYSLSLAIKFAATGKGTKNLMVKSLFIKIKAMERLGEFVQVLPFAVLCKNLRPKVGDRNGIKHIFFRNRVRKKQEITSACVNSMQVVFLRKYFFLFFTKSLRLEKRN